MKPLPVPENAAIDPKATELLRLWIANDKQHVSLNLELHHQAGCAEPEAWGIILADFVQHIAQRLEQQYNLPRDKTIFDLSDMFLRELNRPTD